MVRATGGTSFGFAVKVTKFYYMEGLCECAWFHPYRKYSAVILVRGVAVEKTLISFSATLAWVRRKDFPR